MTKRTGVAVGAALLVCGGIGWRQTEEAPPSWPEKTDATTQSEQTRTGQHDTSPRADDARPLAPRYGPAGRRPDAGPRRQRARVHVDGGTRGGARGEGTSDAGRVGGGDE